MRRELYAALQRAIRCHIQSFKIICRFVAETFGSMTDETEVVLLLRSSFVS